MVFINLFIRLAVAIIIQSLPSFATSCFLPNGTDINLAYNLTTIMPCGMTRPGGSHSMCCDIGSGNDICLPSGICQEFNQRYIRRSCTDPTWQDPGCLKLYIDGDGEKAVNTYGDRKLTTDFTDYYGLKYANIDSELLNCTDGSWCAHSNNHTCCDRKQGFRIDSNGVVSPNTASEPFMSSAATASFAGETSPTIAQTLSVLTTIPQSPTSARLTTAEPNTPTVVPSSSQSNAATSQTGTGQEAMDPGTNNDSTPLGSIIGGAVGGVTGLGLVAALITWLVLRQKSQIRDRKAHDTIELPAQSISKAQKLRSFVLPNETEQPIQKFEMEAHYPRYELSPD